MLKSAFRSEKLWGARPRLTSTAILSAKSFSIRSRRFLPVKCGFTRTRRLSRASSKVKGVGGRERPLSRLIRQACQGIGVQRKIMFTPTADEQYSDLENTPSKAEIFEQVRKALAYLEINPHHPSLNTQEFTSLTGLNGEKVFEAYAQNDTPGAYRILRLPHILAVRAR